MQAPNYTLSWMEQGFMQVCSYEARFMQVWRIGPRQRLVSARSCKNIREKSQKKNRNKNQIQTKKPNTYPELGVTHWFQRVSDQLVPPSSSSALAPRGAIVVLSSGSRRRGSLVHKGNLLWFSVSQGAPVQKLAWVMEGWRLEAEGPKERVMED